MFTNADPIWSAATLAAEVAQSSTDQDLAFAESFLTNLIGALTADARSIFWQATKRMDPSYPNPTFNAFELMRGLRHASRRGVTALDIIARFGGLAEITLERLLNWLIDDHEFVLAG